jgi:hypothetical protein
MINLNKILLPSKLGWRNNKMAHRYLPSYYEVNIMTFGKNEMYVLFYASVYELSRETTRQLALFSI